MRYKHLETLKLNRETNTYKVFLLKQQYYKGALTLLDVWPNTHPLTSSQDHYHTQLIYYAHGRMTWQGRGLYL